jgi:phenylalanyl-tRNA synthetase beta chain
MGDVFSYSDKKEQVGSINERTELAILIKDVLEEKSVYNAKEVRADIYSLRAIVEAVLSRFGVQGVTCEPLTDAPSYFSSGVALVFKNGKNIIARAGELSASLVKEYDLRTAPYVAVIDHALLYSLAKSRLENPPAISELPKYPAVERDLALVLSSSVTAGDLVMAVSGALPKELAEDVRLFDEFQSKEMKASGERSLGVRFTLRSKERTLEDEEVERITANVVSILSNSFNARLRT